MDDIRRQYNATLEKKLQGLITRPMVQAAALKVARNLEDAIRRQANSGRDVNDKPFPDPYTPGYKKQKAKYIKTGKWGKKTLKKTKFAARRVDDKTRLSGQTHEDVIVRVKSVRLAGGFPDVDLEVDAKTSRSKKVVGYLKKNGYDFLGVARASTSAGRDQRKESKVVFLRALKASGGGRFTINEL